MKTFFIFTLLVSVVVATPPACFLSCLSEVSRSCPDDHHDFPCICSAKESMIGCLVDVCPYGNFNSARDHYYGTCLEHGEKAPHPPLYHKPESEDDCDDKDHDHKSQVPQQEPSKDEKSDCPSDCSVPGHHHEKDECSSDCHNPEHHHDSEEQDCEWEEIETTDSQGNVIIVRRPLNVPDDFRKPANSPAVTRKVIIKRPKTTTPPKLRKSRYQQ